ncbi:MAG: bifunctional oligoribonuclease/PAP phosphatase NrnA [Deltaproteobacteria bacterium]|nr:bifunctional oligoribonuclease/PAP phosphatase NrnA [Deltaproteobacteria bacterium]
MTPAIERPPPREALGRVLGSIAGQPLVILLTGHPDPDAIGGALAHQRICESLGIPATIAHVLPVSHRENRALVKLLNIEMHHIANPAELSAYKYFSLVDTSSVETSIDLPADLKLLTVVDHHTRVGGPKVDAAFVDLRPQLGATCSIYAEYLQQGLAPLTGERREDARVATALLFGIQTDTDDFANATPADFAAASYAKAFCDADILKRVGRRTVSAAAMNVLGQALSNLRVIRDFAFAGVGFVPLGDRDAIGSAADYILMREDIDTVLVYGVVEDRVDGSLRTNSPSVDPAVFLQTAFGRDRDGKPYGGGRADKGGFQIPLGLLAECEDTDRLWILVTEMIESRLERVVPDIERERERERDRDRDHDRDRRDRRRADD